MSDIDPTAQDQEQQNQQPAGTGVHSSWDGVLEMFPEGPQREALLSQIRESERNSSTAIQKAREAATPEEWQGIIEAAKESGTTPDEIAESYNQMVQMQTDIAADPDGWLTTMKDQIDQAVERGDISRKEGAQLKKDAASQADAVDLEDPQVAELRKEVDAQKRWREQQEQQAREAQERREQEEAEQASQDATREFIQTFEQTFTGDAALAGVKDEVKYLVANQAVSMIQSDDNLSYADAAKGAIELYRKNGMLPAAGAAPQVPIGGGTNQRLTPPPAAGHGDARGIDKSREQAMLEEIARQTAAGIV